MQCPNCQGDVEILYEHAEMTIAGRFLRWRCEAPKKLESGEAWTDWYARHPDYTGDHDHSMDY